MRKTGKAIFVSMLALGFILTGGSKSGKTNSASDEAHVQPRSYFTDTNISNPFIMNSFRASGVDNGATILDCRFGVLIVQAGGTGTAAVDLTSEPNGRRVGTAREYCQKAGITPGF